MTPTGHRYLSHRPGVGPPTPPTPATQAAGSVETGRMESYFRDLVLAC
jgi:hypothetical protein